MAEAHVIGALEDKRSELAGMVNRLPRSRPLTLLAQLAEELNSLQRGGIGRIAIVPTSSTPRYWHSSQVDLGSHISVAWFETGGIAD